LPKSTGYEHDRPPGFLALHADERAIALMKAVRDGPLGRVELEERLGYGGKGLGERLSRLERMGLLVGRSLPHDGRRREWRLADCGRELLAIDAELERLAAALQGTGEELGALLVRSLADPWDRVILRRLLVAPLPFNELLRSLRAVGHAGLEVRLAQLDSAGLSRRLGRLERLGLVCKQPAARRGAALYARGDQAWRLGRVSVIWALWRWRWTPGREPGMAGDLLGLVTLLADRVRVAANVNEGVVLLHVRSAPETLGWPDVVVALADGRISVLHTHFTAPLARAWATPRVWCEALLASSFEAVEMEGDAAPAHALLEGLAVQLRAP